MSNNWQYGGKESNGISQNNEYMNDLTPMNPINLWGNKPQVGHTRYGYAASTILQEVLLTSENLQNWAILNPGAPCCLLSTSPVFNKLVADRLLKARLPNNDTVCSSHIAELNLPLLMAAGRQTHIILGLKSHSLVSVVKFCNDGCQVDMRDISCEIRYRGETIM